MIPSLVAGELKASIVEYLATTFALSDDETYQSLTAFLLDKEDGIFRGPFLRVRLPFVDAPEDADTGLRWTPPGFRPYAHQVQAWQRLAGRDVTPKPTLITTGTGSGKSEGFLIPVIDHCISRRAGGQRGIKALLLYPMNALVTDQERRIAKLLTDPETMAAGVGAGVWIGDDQSVASRSAMTDSQLISDPGALMNDPPDILLTNYKMLDRLLTTPSRQRLWAANTPPDPRGGWEQPLTYLVLDEFHTYDGAQGTDVAMLLRRLGHRLGIATPQSPLSGIAPVGTSATLGSSSGATGEILEFARKIFGVQFDATALVGEQRKTVEEVCSDIDFSLPAPDPVAVAALSLDDPLLGRDQLALAFTGTGFDDAQAVGDRLLRHPLTAAMLRVVAERPRAWEAAVAAIAQQVPDWGKVHPDQPAEVGAALERFVALISQARGRTGSGGVRPLFSVEVQVWIREVTRLLRSVAKQPAFRWSDSPADPDATVIELPSVYCTECGRAGWMGLANKASGHGSTAMEPVVPHDPPQVYRASISDRSRTRALLRAAPSEPDVLWFDPEDGRLYSVDGEGSARVPVLVGGMTDGDRNETSRDEAAKQQRCPSCGRRDAIRFLGSRVTTLASVGITQMFGSSHVADDERKLLAFTDSVQDASHRAAFFSGRTQRFNLRATMSRAVQHRGRLPLTDIADLALARADAEPKPLDALFSLIPADLLWERELDAAWKQPSSNDAKKARKALAERLGFDAILEAGLRSRFGRTLETTNTAIAEVVVTPEEWERLVAFAVEAVQASTGQLMTEADDIRTWVEGLLARLRLRGGIYHPYLDKYLADHAKRWWIWGGGDRFAPKFPRGISAPAFFSSAASEDLDAVAGAQTWVAQWSKKVLGIEGPGADVAVKDMLDELAKVGVLAERATSKGRVWGLPPERIAFVDVPDDALQTELRCDLCATRHHAPPDQAADWVGRACLRLRCPGQYAPAAAAKANFYRGLYRQGQIRRVVAAEHTGLLTQAHRLAVETGFKDGGRPDAPNVLTSTPTLEMGIDIGDLSAVMLTAVPRTQSSYVQRVGRAGRSTGNAFVTTFAEGDPRSLYFLQDPELMIAGDIAAPNCYLDAIEILRRQYLAFLVDRAAEGPQGPMPAAGEIPRSIRQVAGKGLEAGGWMRVILDHGASPTWVAKFTALFGANLGDETKARLSQWAGSELSAHVERVLGRWDARLKVLINQRDRLREREKELKDKGSLTAEEQESLGRIVAELRAILRRIKEASDAHPLNALEALGLMPNYTLFDDTVTLDVSLWSVNEQHDPNDESSRRFNSDGGEYTRAATRAIRELAPGNSFYVDAHKVKIDAVDNGTEHEPAHSTWRLCPSCAWATSDAASSPPTCPRCGAPGIADQGAIVDVLPLRKVFSTEREITARVGDETEERERLFHDVRALVDIDPVDIRSALLHTGTAFGVETARQATIRYLNLGLSPSRNPRALKIAGVESQSGLFRVCRHCGGVDGVRNRVGDAADLSAHRAWCKVRSGALNEQWDDLALVHELVTEAVRILLPVVEFEHVERTASFKAALMLGLRDSFGGDPAHLRVVESDFPAPGGDPNDRNRLVVLHDTVPGGTGYLTRLADPDRLHDILTRARTLITTCECQTRGKPGCHKCLYGGIDRHELPRVSRVVALELLDEILNAWALEDAPNGTITGINLNPVVQSELERMFKVLLHRWAETAAARVTSRIDPSDSSLRRFDLRFQDGPHWEIREQVDLAVLHGTVPDFYASRVDASGTPDVAIFLDGWAYHGATPAHVDRDAAKRASLRAAGIGVWVLTWKDVRAALEAVSEGGGSVGPVTPFSGTTRNQAAQILAGLFGSEHPAAGVLKLGAFDQLMNRLRHPDADVWQKVGTGVAAAPVRNAPTVDVTDLATTLVAVAGGGNPQPAGIPTEIRAATWQSTGGLIAHTVVQQQPQRCAAVVSLDTSGDVTQDQWSDWLHLGNLLAGLGDDVVITTTLSYNPTAETEPVPVPPVATASSDVEALLADSYDEAARRLGEAGAAAGFTNLVVGFETDWPDGTLVEIAWPELKVGVLPSGAEVPAARDGWTLLVAGAATEAELLAKLESGVA